MPLAVTASCGTTWRSTGRPIPSSWRAARSACGAQSPGGLSDGTRTRSARNPSCSRRCAARKRVNRGLRSELMARNAQMKRANTRSPIATSASVTASAGLWLMPPLQRTNSMPMGAMSMMRHAVVARAGRQVVHRDALAGDRRRDLTLHAAVARRGLRLPQRRDRQRNATPSRDRIELRAHRRRRDAPLLVGGRAHVDREFHLAGNHVHRTGLRLDAADGADDLRHRRSRCAPRPARIPPRRRARRGAGSSAPCPRAPPCRSISIAKRLPPLIAVTTPTGKSLRFQHGALLDVQLTRTRAPGRACARRRELRGIEAEAHQRVAHRDAVARRRLSSSEGSKRAGDRAAAEQRGAVAHALLVAEADHFDGERQTRAASRSARRRIRSRDRTPSMPSYLPASRTVSRCEPSMRHGKPGRVAFVAADAVADRVERRGHAGLAHPARTSAFASRCCGDRNTRVRPPSSSDRRPSASQWSHTRAASRRRARQSMRAGMASDSTARARTKCETRFHKRGRAG